MKKYHFAVDTGIPSVVGIVVEAPDAADARHDAYNVLQGSFGRCARVKTSADEARVIRKLPDTAEPCKSAYITDDTGDHYWAWLIYATPAREG